MTGFTVDIKACEIITFCYYLGGQTTIVTLNLHSHTMTHFVHQQHHYTITLIQRLLNDRLIVVTNSTETLCAIYPNVDVRIY